MIIALFTFSGYGWIVVAVFIAAVISKILEIEWLTVLFISIDAEYLVIRWSEAYKSIATLPDPVQPVALLVILLVTFFIVGIMANKVWR